MVQFSKTDYYLFLTENIYHFDLFLGESNQGEKLLKKQSGILFHNATGERDYSKFFSIETAIGRPLLKIGTMLGKILFSFISSVCVHIFMLFGDLCHSGHKKG